MRILSLDRADGQGGGCCGVLWGVVAERRSRGADAAVLRALASACVCVCVRVRSVRGRAVYILDIILI